MLASTTFNSFLQNTTSATFRTLKTVWAVVTVIPKNEHKTTFCFPVYRVYFRINWTHVSWTIPESFFWRARSARRCWCSSTEPDSEDSADLSGSEWTAATPVGPRSSWTTFRTAVTNPSWPRNPNCFKTSKNNLICYKNLKCVRLKRKNIGA